MSEPADPWHAWLEKTACARIEPSLEDLEHDCARLNAYSVGVRYPDDVFEPVEMDGIDAHSAARRIAARIHAVMP